MQNGALFNITNRLILPSKTNVHINLSTEVQFCSSTFSRVNKTLRESIPLYSINMTESKPAGMNLTR